MKKSEIIAIQAEIITLYEESISLSIKGENSVKKALKMFENYIQIMTLKKRLKF